MGAALVTGASAGIGKELSKLFAADGHDLVLVARRRERLDALADELRGAHGIDPLVIAADLADPSSPGRIHAELERAGVEVEFLVNCAGFGTNGAFVEQELARQMAEIQVNVVSLVALTRLLLPGMVTRGRGRILNIGSTAGFQPGPYMAVYYATKAFVNHFTEGLGYELDGTGVTATVSCPGATDTEFGAVAGNDKSRLFRMGAQDAPSVAKQAYRAMLKGRPVVVHGLKNKLGVQALRFGPRSVIRSMAASLNRS
jgi:hypothetical protein